MTSTFVQYRRDRKGGIDVQNVSYVKPIESDC